MTVSASLDKAEYAPGEDMRLTVAYTVPEDSRVSARAVLDFLGGSASSEPVTALVMRLTVDDPDRAWTLESVDGSTAVYVATA